MSPRRIPWHWSVDDPLTEKEIEQDQAALTKAQAADLKYQKALAAGD